MSRSTRQNLDAPTRQRSFRFPALTLDRLDDRARATGESRNALAARLLDQGLRTDEHPFILFRQGAAGGHGPALAGTRLYVFQVLQTLRASENDVSEAARYLGISDQQVRACVDYYADFKDEVDTEMAEEADIAARERKRASRRRDVLGEVAAR